MASLIYGISSLFAINPGVSLEVEVYFPIFTANLTIDVFTLQLFCGFSLKFGVLV